MGAHLRQDFRRSPKRGTSGCLPSQIRAMLKQNILINELVAFAKEVQSISLAPYDAIQPSVAHCSDRSRKKVIRADPVIESDAYMPPRQLHVSDVVAAQTFPQTVRMSGASISYPHHQQQFASPLEPRLASRNQLRTVLRSANMAAACYNAYELSPPQPPPPPPRTQVPPGAVHKDYSRPLHVDCSVEYELPNTAKPPQGVRNEPLLMIHPCYFRKIERERPVSFINNLPVVKQRRTTMARGQQLAQQMPQQAAQYPVQYAAAMERHMWDPLQPLVPISQPPPPPYPKRDLAAPATTFNSSSSGSGDSGHWTDPERSPDRPEEKHILSGKYRQFLRGHRLHPYVNPAIPLGAAFPQVCYNV